MSGHLAIVAYRSLVEGTPTGKLDFQVRWFPNDDAKEVEGLLLQEAFHRYKNPEGEEVCWELVQIFAIERFEPNEPGTEVAGFIASANELSALV